MRRGGSSAVSSLAPNLQGLGGEHGVRWPRGDGRRTRSTAAGPNAPNCEPVYRASLALHKQNNKVSLRDRRRVAISWMHNERTECSICSTVRVYKLKCLGRPCSICYLTSGHTGVNKNWLQTTYSSGTKKKKKNLNK